MGRLDEIIERNKRPGKHRKGGFPFGIAVAVFVLLILVLMIFTDLDERPDAPAPTPTPEPAAAPGSASHDHHVDGVMLYREKPRVPRDAGSAQATPQP